jgi:hypothetical protein
MSDRQRPSKQRISDELAVGFDSHVVNTWRPILLDQVQRLQAARTPEDFAGVHIDLLARFAARQDVAAERRERVLELKAEQRRLARASPKPKDELRRLQDRIAAHEDLDFRDAVLQHVARCVADGLVWRLLAADRRALTILGDGPLVGRLPDKTGFTAELAAIEAHERSGHLAIHNDLTNGLREADLTVLEAAWPPTTVVLDEVKAREDTRPRGVPEDRLTRQAERLDRKLRILRDNHDPDAGDGAGARLLRLPVAYRTYLDALAPILARARRDGHASEIVAEGILVSAVDYVTLGDAVGVVGAWQADDPVAAWGPLPTGRRIQGSTFVRRYEDRLRHSQSYRAVAPVSLLPIGAEEIVDLLLGRMDFCVTVRFDVIEAAFARRGIQAVCAGTDSWDAQLLAASRGDLRVTVPPHLGAQLTQELMTVETLVDVVEALLDELAAGRSPDGLHMLFCDERGTWPGLVL